MENYEFPFFGSSDWEKEAEKKQQEYLENLLKKPPQPVNFTYTLEELKNAVDKFTPEPIKEDNTPAPRIIEDYYDEWYENHKDDYNYGNAEAVIGAVYSFYGLKDKNDLSRIENICNIISNNRTSKTQLPTEIKMAISEIYEQRKYLEDMKKIDDYNKEQALKTEKENIKVQEEQERLQELQIQQARYNEIQSKLPIINEQLDRIRELPKNSDVYETRKNELLRERLYFYHKVNASAMDLINSNKKTISQEDIDRLNAYLETLNNLEQEIVNSNKQAKQEEPVQEVNIDQQPNLQEQEQINQLKAQIQQYDNQIAMLLAGIQPYMQVPKINNEISKVITKNNEINSSQIIDSLTDYQRVVEMKQQLVTYLQQADKVIKDKVAGLQQQEQKVEEQPIIQEQPQIQPQTQSTNQIPNDDFWDEFDAPQQEPKQQEPLPDNFWDEFDNPQQMTRPEKIYNDDGTYTMEYIAYQANTPLGFNQTIYDQLLQHNTDIRTKKNNAGLTSQQAEQMIQAMVNGQLDTNGQPIVDNQEQMTNDRQMGFAKVWMLGLITTLVSIGIIVLGIILTK